MSSFFVQALQGKESLFPKDDNSKLDMNRHELTAVRTFVAILLSGTPAAVNQLVVTQLYNPEGSAHTLASFLMLQCESLCRVSLTGRYSYAGAFDCSRCDWDLCCREVGYEVHNLYFYVTDVSLDI